MKITRRSVPVKAAINKLPAGIKPADTPVKDYAEELASAVCKSLTDNGYICEYKVSTKSIVFTVAVDTNADIDINFTLPLSVIVPEATVSADMATVVDKIMNLAPLTSPGTDVDLTAEVTSSTRIQASEYRQYEDPELLERQIEDITAEYESRKAAGELDVDEAWSYEQEIQELKDRLRFAYADEEYDGVDLTSASVMCASDSELRKYGRRFGDALIEDLWDDYDITAEYKLTDDSIIVYVYADRYKSALLTTVTRELQELLDDSIDLGTDVANLAAEIDVKCFGEYSVVDSATGVESIDDKEPVLGSYKDDEAYKKLLEYDYTLDLLDNGCVIRFSDGDPYATFKFVPADLSEFEGSETWTPEDIKRYGLDEWLVYADGDMINERIDYPPTNYDEAVKTAIRYFWSHY